MTYDQMKSLVKLELWLEKEHYDELLWLCNEIHETEPHLVAEALLQVAIEDTVSDPEQMAEWLKVLED